MRSPSRSTRSSTSSNISWRRCLGLLGALLDLVPGAGGGDAGQLAAAQRVGADGGLGGHVLAPVEEDLAGPQRLGHLPQHQPRVLLGHLLRQLHREVAHLVAGEVAAERRVELHPLAAGGHRVHLQPEGGQPIAHQESDFRALVQAGRLARVEVDDQPVGVSALAVVVDRPLRHVDLEAVEVDQVGEVGQVGDQRVGDVVDRHPLQPARGPGGQVLLEEHLVLDTVRPAHPRHRAVGDVRQHQRRDLRVIGEHLALGRLGRGVHHLVQAGEPQLSPGHLDPGHLGHVLRHRRPPPGRPGSGRCAPRGRRAGAAGAGR